LGKVVLTSGLGAKENAITFPIGRNPYTTKVSLPESDNRIMGMRFGIVGESAVCLPNASLRHQHLSESKALQSGFASVESGNGLKECPTEIHASQVADIKPLTPWLPPYFSCSSHHQDTEITNVTFS
jgi:hypothetical protein